MKKEMNKNDRRYAFTHSTLKDALLELLQTTDFNQITVSSLCRQAQVGRATFYTHYDNLTDVIEELVEDAIQATQRSSAGNSIKGLQEFARSLSADRSFTELGDKVLLLPVCQRVSDNPKYNVLFRDSTLSEYILSMIYRQERDHQIRELMKYDLTEKEADMLFTYLLTGAFAVNKAMGWKKDKDWMRVQQIILNFVSSGIDGLKGNRTL